MSEVPAAETLKAKLDALAGRGASLLRTRRARLALRAGVERCAPWLVAAPSFWVVVELHRLSSLSGPIAPHWSLILALTASPLAVYVLWCWARERVRPIDRVDALAAIDRALVEQDRLLAADEFLGRGERSGFMEAAIEDARGRVEMLLRRELDPETVPLVAPRRWARPAALAVVLLLVASWLDQVGSTSVAAEDVEQIAALPDIGEMRSRPEPGETQEPDRELDPEPEAGFERTDARDSAGEAVAESSELSDTTKESRGQTRSGRSSDARSSSPGSQSRGSPSQQGQVAKGTQSKTQDPAKKSPKKKDAQDSEAKVAKNEEQSGSTAGRGASKGSNKNPVVSDWSSRDHVSTPDDEDIEHDQETEDEDEEQESRGGIQPHLRDRRPPVSRDLRIGFGNRPNPDANGRGGPSAHKKSRGVASLVLGVPIPDRIKGQPNAGKTKITQERIEPKAEDSPPGVAQERRPREAPFGAVRDPEMSSWMRDLVRRYFLRLRQPAANDTGTQP